MHMCADLRYESLILYCLSDINESYLHVPFKMHFMFVHYTFSSVLVAEWPPFGKKLPARSAICSPCILSICNIYLFPALVFRAGFAF